MGKLYMNEELFGSDDSKDIKYDNSTSQIEADNVQGAIDYILENGTGNSSDMELTYAEYLKLSNEEKHNGTNYFIKDLNNKKEIRIRAGNLEEEKEIIGSASSISYSGTESGLSAETVQAAIDELKQLIGSGVKGAAAPISSNSFGVIKNEIKGVISSENKEATE